MSDYKFDIGNEVVVHKTGEKGLIIGKSEVVGCANQYFVRKECDDTEISKTYWHDEGEIVLALYLS